MRNTSASHWILLVALLASVVVYLLSRPPGAEAQQSSTTHVEPVDDAEIAAEEVEVGLQRNVIAEDGFVDAAAAVVGTHVLRVILEGVTEETARETTVKVHGSSDLHDDATELQDSWTCLGFTSEFPLDPYFAIIAAQDENLHIDELAIQVEHPLHLIETTRVTLTDGTALENGQTVYEVRVQLVPAAVIYGRLLREDGSPAAQGLVGALLLEESTWERPTTNGETLTDVPVEAEGRAVECGADGAFELRVIASGRYALASYEEGQRPTTTRIDVSLGTRMDLGTVVLTSGYSISGYAMRSGIPMTGATISLMQPRSFWAADPANVEMGMKKWILSWRTFTSPARSVQLGWFESGFELLGQKVSTLVLYTDTHRLVEVDETGEFSFGGLAPRDYRLRVMELPGTRFLPSGWDNTDYEVTGPDEMIVRAPAHGVKLDYSWTSIHFKLMGDFENDDEGRLVLRTKSLYPGNGRNFVPEFWSTQFPLAGDEPDIVLEAPSNVQILGEVMFPGRQLVALDFMTAEPGGEVMVPIELVPAEDAATLLIQLENTQTEIPETFSVMLRRAGQEATPDTRQIQVLEGQLLVEDIVPGQYRVDVFASKDTNHPGLFFSYDFEFDFHPGLIVTRSIKMQAGAGLRLTLHNEAGELLGGHYDLFDHEEKEIRLVMVDSERWQSGSDAYATTGGFGPSALKSSEPILPGTYRLVLFSPGYENGSVAVKFREGEFEEVDVTLVR